MMNNLSDKDKKAFALIRNKIVHYGESPSLREINEVTGGKSPRSASLVVDRLIEAGLIVKGNRSLILTNTHLTNSISTVDVPLVGAVACGVPMFAEENIQAHIPVSTALAKKGSKYFLLRASGDSMNEAGINSGDLLLVRKQDTADNGERVVALINDEATVKIFERGTDAVILRPKSTNKEHKPIVLTDNCIIQGVVQAVLPSDIY
ncbi:MAG TPA: transcriptional repressor LexA [Candidatus Paceibacterota bacterium]|nr:transcriptional repressor LexA [Candidatus Paceibacterota bacterium]HMO82573.1 transcriptional repressor LexA [Candidatus Paceibacterota bacterium]